MYVFKQQNRHEFEREREHCVYFHGIKRSQVLALSYYMSHSFSMETYLVL